MNWQKLRLEVLERSLYLPTMWDYLLILSFSFWLTTQTNSKNSYMLRLKIHPAHNLRFNHDLQLEIDWIEWALKKIEVNKIPNDRLDGLIRKMIKDLEKRKDKAMKRSDTDDLWIKIESLQWVLFVIFTIKTGNMVVI